MRAQLAGADPAAAHTADHERASPVREVARALDRGDRADPREPAVDAGHEHDPVAGVGGRRAGPLRLVGLERDRDHHLREHDALSEGQQGQELGLGV